jgi:hypothetical protein
MPARRFPPPWSVEEQSACYVVRDPNNGDVRFWHKADMPTRSTNVRFQG